VEVARVEVLFASSQLASTLRMDVHILPVGASLLTCPLPNSTAQPAQAGASKQAAGELPEAASRVPILEVTDVNASATVQLIGCAFVGLSWFPNTQVYRRLHDCWGSTETQAHCSTFHLLQCQTDIRGRLPDIMFYHACCIEQRQKVT